MVQPMTVLPLRLLALLAFPVTAVVVLHRLGDVRWLAIPYSDLGTWLGATPPEDAAMAVLRLVALACAWWLLASTTLYLLARASRVPAAIRAAGWLTLPAARRMVDRALAVTLVSSGALGGAPALAAEELRPPPPETAVMIHHTESSAGDEAIIGPGAAAVRTGQPGAVMIHLEQAAEEQEEPAQADDEAAPVTITVVEGDHLWSIAARHLAAAQGRDTAGLTEHEIAPYWRVLVEHNRPHLTSGDPDLVFPGEEIALPPVPSPS